MSNSRDVALASTNLPSLNVEFPSPGAIFAAPVDQLPALEANLNSALAPIDGKRCRKAVAVMFAMIPKAPETMKATPEVLVQGMVEELCTYPEDVVNEAIKQARRTFIFTPSIAEMVKLCNGLMTDRRDAERALGIRKRLAAGKGIKGFAMGNGDYAWMLKQMLQHQSGQGEKQSDRPFDLNIFRPTSEG